MADGLEAGANLGKVYGEGARCPSCGAFARVLPSEEYRWVCGVCGAPRLALEGEAPPTESDLALAEAGRALRTWGMQRLGAFLMGVPAGLGLLLAVVLGLASYLAAGVLIAASVFLALLASRASRRAGTEKKRARAAVERAYEAAIAALMTKNLGPAEIAAKLRVPEADVEAALAAQGHVRVAVPARIAAEMEKENEYEHEHEHEGKA